MTAFFGALSRSVAFIAWSNFVEPGVLWLWFRSLALLASACIVAWAAGSRLCRPLRFRSAAERLVLTLSTGLGAFAILATALALAGLYRWWIVGLVCVVVVAAGVRDLQVLPSTVRAVVIDAPAAAALAVVCSMPALLPPYRWDEAAYHLAYPQQWIAVGHVTIDPHLAYPLYTLTWQALLGFALMTGSTSLAHLLTWLTGVLAAWCIPLFLTRLGVAPMIGRVARVAFLVTPLVLSMLDVGMVDVPIMCFLTVAVYALVMLSDEHEILPAHVVPAALCAGVFVSLKITNVVYLPLFFGLAALRLPRRTLAAYAGACAAVGCIWYVRNWVIAGDPLTPLIAHALGRPAPYWSIDDLRAQAADLRGGLSYAPSALLALPLRLLGSVDDSPMRGPPLLGYVLIVPLSWVTFVRRWQPPAREVLAATWFAIAAWVATTYFIRYAYWVPLGIVSAALVIEQLMRRVPQSWRRWDWAVSTLLLLGPTPNSIRYAKEAFHNPIPLESAARRAFAFHGCADACAFGAVVARARPAARLYTVLPPMNYYWQAASFRVVSGAFHPGGFGEFASALKAGHLKAFLGMTGADYVVVDDNYAAYVFGSVPDVSDQLRDALGPPIWSASGQAVFAIPSTAVSLSAR